MTIRHDRSSTSIVTKCSECPHWFAFNFDRDKARESGERHELQVHDRDPREASGARRQAAYRRRHAVNS